MLGALKDFNKEQKSEKEDISKVNILESMPDKNISDISEDTWTTDFIKQAAEQFEENLQNFIQNGTFYNLKKIYKSDIIM